MERSKVFLLLTVLALVLLASPVSADSKGVTLNIQNPGGPLLDGGVVFFIPFGAKPVGLSANAVWNETSRELTISLGSFTAKEIKTVNFTLDGPAGPYLLSGKVSGRWPATGVQPEEFFDQTIESFRVTLGDELPRGVLDNFLDNLRSIPEAVNFAKNVAIPAAVVLGAAGVGAVVNTALSASAELAVALSKFFSYLGLGFLRIRKRKPWGRIYNRLTGRPIESAIVKVLDAKFKKVKETQVTDSEGRFGFLVRPGEYYLKVSRSGFSDKETPVIKVLGAIQTLNIEIALESLQAVLPSKSYSFLKVIRFFLNLLDRLTPWILALGSILSIITVLVAPSVLAYVVLGVYAALIILKLVFHEVFFKSFGWVLDRVGDKPLPLAVVRLFDAKKNWLLGTRVTGEDGRFNFLIGPGDYYVTAVKESYKPFQSAATHFNKSGLISYDIKLER